MMNRAKHLVTRTGKVLFDSKSTKNDTLSQSWLKKFNHELVTSPQLFDDVGKNTPDHTNHKMNKFLASGRCKFILTQVILVVGNVYTCVIYF